MADIEDLIRQASVDAPRSLEPHVCEALMLAYYDFVYRLAAAMLGDADDAEDAAQETFIQAGLHIDQYQAGTNLKSWIARIAVNVCRGRFRRQKARQRLTEVLKRMTLQMHAALPSPEETALVSERQRMLRQAVDALDEKHRIPILLRYVQGLSVAEIAQILDEKEGTIHSRLHYAHQKLRGQLGGALDDLSTDRTKPL